MKHESSSAWDCINQNNFSCKITNETKSLSFFFEGKGDKIQKDFLFFAFEIENREIN